MASYTIEIRELLTDKNFNVFNFPYDFYIDDESIKADFEKKFINHFFFHEIGCETVARWKMMLQSKLNLIMPYYKQLYQTELESQNINFLLNKDLLEEFTRELTGNHHNSGVSDSQTSSNETMMGESNNKQSNLSDGVASVSLSNGYLTGVGQDKTNTSNSTNLKGNVSTTSNSENKEMETTRLVSQGNIGTTSSAELLEKWRGVLINIDQLIINECESLFMKIY